jgi:hypothetical protein
MVTDIDQGGAPTSPLPPTSGQGQMTMEGLRRIALIALIIALGLFLLVILGFAAYSIFVFAKWLIGLV